MFGFRTIIASLAGIVLVVGVAVTASLTSRPDKNETAGVVPAVVAADRIAPNARNNPMVPVVQEEASRRSELHGRMAEEAMQASGQNMATAYIAPPVVTEIRSSTDGDDLTRAIFEDRIEPEPEPEPVVAEVEPEPEPEPEPVVAEVEPEPEPAPVADHWNYYGEYGNRLRIDLQVPQREVTTIRVKEEHSNLLLDALDFIFMGLVGTAHAGGLAEPVMEPPVRPSVFQDYRIGTTDLFGSPHPNERSAARPELVGINELGQAYGTQAYHDRRVGQAQQGRTVLARAGDMVYARLLYGFNSDDVRGLPVYAIVTDILDSGAYGPLHNARIEGGVGFTRENASISFNRIILTDGREIPMSGIAVSADAARTGVAAKIDKHRLQNFGSLFLAGLFEGAGRIMEYRLTDGSGDTIILNTGSGEVSVPRDRNDLTDGELLAGALGPVGRNISREIERNGQRPPTISAPGGHIFGLVFVDTLVYDPETMRGQSAYNPRTGQSTDVGIDALVGRPDPQGSVAGAVGQPPAMPEQRPNDGWTIDSWGQTGAAGSGNAGGVPSAIRAGVGQ